MWEMTIDIRGKRRPASDVDEFQVMEGNPIGLWKCFLTSKVVETDAQRPIDLTVMLGKMK
jgi:hypothetical protein